MGTDGAVAMPPSFEHGARRLDGDEAVDARRETAREIARACAKLKNTAWMRSEQGLKDFKRLQWIWRPVSIRCRDLLVAELSSLLGREMLRFGSICLGQGLIRRATRVVSSPQGGARRIGPVGLNRSAATAMGILARPWAAGKSI